MVTEDPIAPFRAELEEQLAHARTLPRCVLAMCTDQLCDDPASPAEVAAVRARLEADPRVRDVRLSSPAQEHERFLARFRHDPERTAGTGSRDHAPTFRFDTDGDLGDLLDELRELPGVADVRDLGAAIVELETLLTMPWDELAAQRAAARPDRGSGRGGT